MSNDLRSKVIRLAHQNPALRPHLLPLLKGGNKVASAESDFIDGYIEGLLHTSDDEDGRPLNRSYNARDLDSASLHNIQQRCRKFLSMPGVEELIDGREEEAGTDFWLTHNGHGAGFWDGDWEDDAGKILTAASKKFSESYVYVEDGSVFVD